MSGVSFMDKLLDGVEVEWRPLKAVLVRTKGTKITAGQMKELHKDGAPVKIFAGGRTVAFVNYDDIPAKDINRQPSIIVKSRGIIEFEYYEKPFSHKNEMWSYHSNKHEISIKYLYHFLKLNEPYFQSIGGKMQMPQIATPDTDKFPVPIPCPDNPKKSLEIQAEIVRILDAFTAMTAELTAELNLRKKQYNHYRDQLLSFAFPSSGGVPEGRGGQEVEWKTLGEVGRIVTGRTPKSSEKSAWGDEVDFVTPSDIKNGMRSITCPSRRLSAEGAASMPKVQIPSGSLLVTCIGADMGKTVINANDCIPNQQINAIILTDDNVQISYLFHVLTAMRDTLRRQGELGGGTMPLINKSDFSKIVVPVPSLDKQARIVAILDKFDALTNSITEGLPREIELRQKQYEYYRDLLLSFPKPEAAAA
jgi:type I restriction enzyme S subunit